jgi:hypothetical protein
MGAFPVSLEKESQLAQRMAALGVGEAEIEESFIRPGKGRRTRSKWAA